MTTTKSASLFIGELNIYIIDMQPTKKANETKKQQNIVSNSWNGDRDSDRQRDRIKNNNNTKLSAQSFSIYCARINDINHIRNALTMDDWTKSSTFSFNRWAKYCVVLYLQKAIRSCAHRAHHSSCSLKWWQTNTHTHSHTHILSVTIVFFLDERAYSV